MKRKIIFPLLLLGVSIVAQVSIKVETNDLKAVAPGGILDLRNTNALGDVYPFVIDSAPSSSDVNFVTDSLSEGSLYYDTTDKCLKVFNGTKFVCTGF